MELEQSIEQFLRDCTSNYPSRADLWVEFARRAHVARMAEIGVYKGDFAAILLDHCPAIEKYYMLDPWRHLDDWNKPANENDETLSAYFERAKANTDFASHRRVILRGKTTEVIDRIPDADLDFAYIDGDHTLKGIAIDLIRVYPKVKMAGFIGGDDFSPTIWQHNTGFEPTLVCPFAVYFAEAVGATIYALPNSQFCMQKTSGGNFSFVDLTGRYCDLTLRNQILPEKSLRMWLSERYPRLTRIARKSRQMISP